MRLGNESQGCQIVACLYFCAIRRLIGSNEDRSFEDMGMYGIAECDVMFVILGV